jgi:biopolymer transport protein TolR
MVAAPMLTVGVPVDLPQSQAPALNQEREPLTVTVNNNGEIFLQDTKVSLEDIVPRLNAITKQGYDERIYVRGDARVNYGQVMKVMGLIAGAGFKRVALVTEVEQGG